jgi:hypothetical protein
VSPPPWVNYTRYLCRVPNQQDCFTALENDGARREGCLLWCCYPCSMLGSVIEPFFVSYVIRYPPPHMTCMYPPPHMTVYTHSIRKFSLV